MRNNKHHGLSFAKTLSAIITVIAVLAASVVMNTAQGWADSNYASGSNCHNEQTYGSSFSNFWFSGGVITSLSSIYRVRAICPLEPVWMNDYRTDFDIVVNDQNDSAGDNGKFDISLYAYTFQYTNAYSHSFQCYDPFGTGQQACSTTWTADLAEYGYFSVEFPTYDEGYSSVYAYGIE